jgi:hypothetical protein
MKTINIMKLGIFGVGAAVLSLTLGSGWDAKAEDNICGLANLSQVSNPGVIIYDSVWNSTKSIKKMKSEGIDSDSPQGQILRSKARQELLQACQQEMNDTGLDSVWKTITHKSKTPTNITLGVVANL